MQGHTIRSRFRVRVAQVRGSSRLAGAHLALACALACGAPRATGVAEPVSAAAAPPASAPAAPPEEPTPVSPSPVSTADAVVTLVAKPYLWPLHVDAASRVLEQLGPLRSEQPSASALSLAGGPFGSLQSFEVAYSLDPDSYWEFGSAGFVLREADPVALYHALAQRLAELLGKPLRVESVESPALPAVAWNLGEAMTLSLAPSAEGDECVVRIEGGGAPAPPEPERRPPARRASRARR